MSLREDVARRAYVWALPTVALYGVLHELVLAPPGPARAPCRWDRVLPAPPPARVPAPPGPADLGSASSCAWLDLRRGPVRLDLDPDPPAGAVAVTLVDLYADEVGRVPEDLAPPGSACWVVGPSWDPPVTTGDTVVLRCGTDLCLAVGRPRAEGLQVHPSDSAGGGHPPLPPPVPPVDVRLPPTTAFLAVLDWMLPLLPTRPGEEDLRADLEVLGVGSGPAALAEAVAEDRVDGQVTAGLRHGFEDVRRAQMSSSSRPRRTASWARATDSFR